MPVAIGAISNVLSGLFACVAAVTVPDSKSMIDAFRPTKSGVTIVEPSLDIQ